MATGVGEAVLTTIDTMVKNRISKLAVDKTVTAKIKKCVDQKTGKYSLTYQGGIIFGYAQDSKTYTEDQSVYLLIPESNMSKRKIILGLSDETEIMKLADTTYTSLDDYNRFGENIAGTIVPTVGLDVHALNQKKSIIKIDEGLFNQNISKTNGVFSLGAVFNTANLSRQAQAMLTGKYGLILKVVYGEEEKLFVFDSTMMSGEPLKYSKGVFQYRIFTADPLREATHVELTCFCTGFDFGPNSNKAGDGQDEIYISDVELFGLTDNVAAKGEYKMYYTTPGGIYFTEQNNTLPVRVTVKKSNVDITNTAQYMLFQMDGRVTEGSEGYNAYGGKGWKHVRSFSAKEIQIEDTDGSYDSVYKIVCVLQEEAVISTEFTLYNKTQKRTVSVVANNERFFDNNGEVCLDCRVEPEIVDGEYIWKKTDPNGEEIVYNDLNKTKPGDDLHEYNQGLLNGVVLDGNILKCPASSIQNGSAVFTCQVVLDGKSIGSGSVKIFNSKELDKTDDYHIVIKNGTQSFKYDDGGASPTHEKNEIPQKIQPLECQFFDQSNIEIDPEKYQVTWSIPSEDTMIAETSQENNVLNFDIKNTYNPNFTNNQISVTVTYNEIVRTETTSLVFMKEGENGTNGTKYSAYIKKIDDKKYEAKLVCGGDYVSNIVCKWNINVLDNDKPYIDISMVKKPIDVLSVEINYLGKVYSASIPIVSVSPQLTIAEPRLFSDVKYGPDGTAPYYNRNCDTLKIEAPEGGVEEFTVSGLNLLLDTDSKKWYNKPDTEGVIVYEIKVIPKQTYTKSNEQDKVVFKYTINETTLQAVVPVNVYTDRYSNVNINGWDGKGVQIKDDEYVIAPQIGAGTKNNDNTFTGILMGETNSGKTGLFGFNNGIQSVFIDANTGNATFGKTGSGQIIINPSGESTIGGWKIGETNLYNTNEQGGGVYLDAGDNTSITIKGKPNDNGSYFTATLNPAVSSIFSISRFDKGENDSVKEVQLAGINEAGEFFTSSATSADKAVFIQQNEVKLEAGGFVETGHFGFNAKHNDIVFFKAYTDDYVDSPLIISGSNDANDRTARAIELYGSNIQITKDGNLELTILENKDKGIVLNYDGEDPIVINKDLIDKINNIDDIKTALGTVNEDTTVQELAEKLLAALA